VNSVSGLKTYGLFFVNFVDLTVSYRQQNYQDCLKRLSTLKSFDGITSNFTEFFILNSLGCINMNLKAPTVAYSFFNKAYQKIKSVEEDNLKDWSKETRRAECISIQGKSSQILKNLALSQYRLGNFSAAWKIYEKVSQSNVNDYLFWYRFAVCGFNWFINECENRTRKVRFSHKGEE
jgi:tetratricopeptide (TPR) repeat protein